MKILIDECLPVALKNHINLDKKHIIRTVKDMEWIAYKNGMLINNAVDSNFDIFITLDSKMRFQQNLLNIRMIFIFLKVKNNKLDTILEFAKPIEETIIKIENKTIKHQLIEL